MSHTGSRLSLFFLPSSLLSPLSHGLCTAIKRLDSILLTRKQNFHRSQTQSSLGKVIILATTAESSSEMQLNKKNAMHFCHLSRQLNYFNCTQKGKTEEQKQQQEEDEEERQRQREEKGEQEAEVENCHKFLFACVICSSVV
jgi:outer membrane biosynthesis protein TonB